MKQNIGIWIDAKHAVVIKLTEEGHSMKKIESRIDLKKRVSGESKKYGRFGSQYLTYEKNEQNKRKQQTHKFFRSLLVHINKCDELVIFGPAKMKLELKRELDLNNLFANKVIGIYDSPLITDNQMVAWVKDFYK